MNRIWIIKVINIAMIFYFIFSRFFYFGSVFKFFTRCIGCQLSECSTLSDWGIHLFSLLSLPFVRVAPWVIGPHSCLPIWWLCMPFHFIWFVFLLWNILGFNWIWLSKLMFFQCSTRPYMKHHSRFSLSLCSLLFLNWL